MFGGRGHGGGGVSGNHCDVNEGERLRDLWGGVRGEESPKTLVDKRAGDAS